MLSRVVLSVVVQVAVAAKVNHILLSSKPIFIDVLAFVALQCALP